MSEDSVVEVNRDTYDLLFKLRNHGCESARISQNEDRYWCYGRGRRCNWQADTKVELTCGHYDLTGAKMAVLLSNGLRRPVKVR